MSYSLQETQYQKLLSLFSDFAYLLTPDLQNRLMKSIQVLHFYYLYGSCKEVSVLLKKDSKKYQNTKLFTLIMLAYNKRRKIHLSKCLLLNCFENALRSTLAIKIANLYNTNDDTWFLKTHSQNLKENALLKQINRILLTRKIDINTFKNTFEIFDIFTFGDLKSILDSHYNELELIFKSENEYKEQILPSYGTKKHLIDKIEQIRCARNELFHNKPTKIKFQKDLEILLLRLGYNLADAINLGDISNAMKLHYKYK